MLRRLPWLAVLLVVLVAGAQACDNFADYSVRNETDEILLTWLLLGTCDSTSADQEDFLPEILVAPHETVAYSSSYSPGRDATCIQVATSDRRLVLSDKYQDGKTYIVRAPLRPAADPVPERGQLAKESWGETMREEWPLILGAGIGLVLFLGLAVGLAAGIVVALLVVVRHFWHFYVSRR